MPTPSVCSFLSCALQVVTCALQEFEVSLKDLVTAKRLSASKIQKLTELALACMEVRTTFLRCSQNLT